MAISAQSQVRKSLKATNFLAKLTGSPEASQVLRFIINGVVATAVHFAVLTFNLHVVGMNSAGLANIFAAMIGITASFLGSRYFVFRSINEKILCQAAKFCFLYIMIAALHGIVLYLWTDVWFLDYRIGFLIATGFQVFLSYFGNKICVFKK